jgi:hypothetical protein
MNLIKEIRLYHDNRTYLAGFRAEAGVEISRGQNMGQNMGRCF